MFINFFSIIAAAIAGFGVGGFWYSSYGFGKQWRELMGIEEGKEMPKARFTPTQAMAIEFGLTFVMGYVLAIIAVEVGISGPLTAIRLAFWTWLGFIATTMFSSVIFENKPIKLLYINAGYRLTALVVMALIIGLWNQSLHQKGDSSGTVPCFEVSPRS